MKSNFFLVLLLISVLFQGRVYSQTPKMVLMPEYSEIFELFGFKDTISGRMMVPFKFDYADDFYDGMAKVKVSDKWGFVNTQGKLVVPCKYDYADDYEEGIARVELNEKQGFIDKKGMVVIPLKFDRLGSFNNGLATATMNRKSGFINKSGQWVIPPKYESCGPFTNGMAVVGIDGREGVINKSGKWILPLAEMELSHFSGELFVAKVHDKYGILDTHGKWLMDTVLSSIYSYEDYLGENSPIRVKKDGLYGFIDRKGAYIIEPRYENISNSGQVNIMCVKVVDGNAQGGSRWGLVDLNKKMEITEIKYQELGEYGEGCIPFAYNNKVGYLDTEGREIIPGIYESGWEFKYGLAIVQSDGKMMLINKENQVVSERYDFILTLENGFYAANNGGTWEEDMWQEKGEIKGGKYGLMDRKGKALTEVKYDYFENFSEGIAIVKSDGIPGILDTLGNEKLFPDYQSVLSLHEGLAAVYSGGEYNEQGELDGGKWGFIDRKGTLVVPIIYDNGRIFSEGLSLMQAGTRQVFIDKEGNEVILLDGYESVESFSSGMAKVLKNGKYGYIDKTGKLIIPCIYDEASDFDQGLARVWKGDVVQTINTKGLIVK